MSEGQSFQDFILGCARAFGACIMMRDDPHDTPIPERFEPSDYHKKRIAEATAELSRLRGLNEADRVIYGETRKATDIQQSQKWLEKERQENERLSDMEQKVNAWTPPTSEHTGLKDFMLDQIKISKNKLGYIEASMEKSRAKPPMDYYTEAVAQAQRDIEYNITEHAEEVERANSRTDWVQQLRKSI